jgi:hypothetical protein
MSDVKKPHLRKRTMLYVILFHLRKQLEKMETKSDCILYCLEFNKGQYTIYVAAELRVNLKTRYSRLITHRERGRGMEVRKLLSLLYACRSRTSIRYRYIYIYIYIYIFGTFTETGK